MLAAWPLICLLLFTRLPARQALLASVLAGYLLLPAATRFDLQGLPDLDKSSMIAIGAGLGTLLFTRSNRQVGGAWLIYGLGAVFVVTPFATAYFNPDPIVGQNLFFPGLSWYDGLSQAGAHLFALVPFWAGRRILPDERGHVAILRAIVAAMLVYSIFILVEVRLSPQLHNWVYGFFPHSFQQQMRGGGFRAVVFLGHGLVVAMFLGLGLIAAVVLGRRREAVFGVNHIIWALYLLIILLLQKSLGAAMLAVLIGAVVLFASPKRQLGVAAIVAALVMSYPVLRGSHLLPLVTIQAATESIDSDRASSLNVRLENEEMLLNKAAQRPMFGWGSWGRNRVYDLDGGRDISITDGTWVIAMGSFGWFGFLAQFGLLALPVIRLRWIYRRVRSIPAATVAVTLLLVFNLCDLIPNSSVTPFTWLVAGALLGRKSRPRVAVTAPADELSRTGLGDDSGSRSGATGQGIGR